MSDQIRHPAHYTIHRVQPIELVMGMEYWRGNIIKYAARAGAKLYEGMNAVQSEITDLEKVRRYAEMRMNELRGLPLLADDQTRDANQDSAREKADGWATTGIGTAGR